MSDDNMSYRVLVTGSRDWGDNSIIRDTIRDITDAHRGVDIILVSGNCPTGADAQAEEWADLSEWKLELHPADWEAHGKAAGPKRNAEMVALGADVCIAFIKNQSRGASMTAAFAEAAGIPTRRFVCDYPKEVAW